MRSHPRLALHTGGYVLTNVDELARTGGLVSYHTDKSFSEIHETGKWQSSLASVRKLSDTSCVEQIHSSYISLLMYMQAT